MNNDIIISNIKQLRKIYDLTQQDLADKISFGRSTIGQIESGHSNPTSQLLNAISLVFGINKKWLETGQGPMKKNNKEILEQAINLINDLPATEKAFLELMENKLQDQNKEKATFYRLLHSLLETYQQADRDTQGYIIIQLRKSFSELLEE
ncbi:helix-turn-helix domain-containing protein [Halocella sp. SP3-1]|uniref:helix-turn-helix domain-containing protein n=1 Tax=Halocella sp. SP3-1 TaxID=2382161 RepID=UPI000F75F3D5|nr:helix-turn-helix domain-containing protein [Halocella sp. SP3-1]AZO94571.1 helix-turn-helix domain-containing protein [Halocella sp. SP3-1]